MLKILVVDDHPLIRSALKDKIGSLQPSCIVQECGTGAAAMKIIMNDEIDLIILDLNLQDGDGSRLIPAIEIGSPTTKIVILTSDPLSIPSECLEYKSLISIFDKSRCDLEAVEEMIKTTLEASHQQSQSSKSNQSNDLKAADIHILLNRVNASERKIFIAMGEGKTNKEIAKKLSLSHHTVEGYRKHLANIFGVSGSSLIRLAVIYTLWLEEKPT